MDCNHTHFRVAGPISRKPGNRGHRSFEFELQRLREPNYVPIRPVTPALASNQTPAPDISESDEVESYEQSPTRHLNFEQSQPLERETPRKITRRRFQGWRFGVALNASIVALILMTNVMLVAIAASKLKLSGGIGTLYVGNCNLVNKLNIGVHVLINALSSALLGASNYAMQCMLSPTRSECDAAHARGDWLDIGVPGVRNVRRIRGQRRILWALLLMTSIPIHLIYNSAVFKTLDTNEYRYAVLGDHLVDMPAMNASQLTTANRGAEMSRLQHHEEPNMYDKLDIEACISVYGSTFVSGYSNVILMTTNETYDDTYAEGNAQLWGNVSFYHDDGTPSGNEFWACEGLKFSDHNTNDDWHRRDRYCHGSDAKLAANWTVFGYRVDHCKARRTGEHCKLQFSLHLMLPIIICNLIKAASMFLALFYSHEAPLVTFGDALAVWLDVPDVSSKGRCLISKDEIIKSSSIPSEGYSQHSSLYARRRTAQDPIVFSSKNGPNHRSHYWCGAVSPKRWAVTILFCMSVVTLAFAFLPFSLERLEFGSFNPQRVISMGSSRIDSTDLVACVLLANLPQLVLSLFYFMYNGLYTSMHLAHEYSSYAVQRKPLRVTDPQGDQRSTYWLQLPYRYGIPLLLTSSLLHWLVSQSIFLARVAVWRDAIRPLEIAGGENAFEGRTSSVVGYSGLPLLCVVTLGVIMLLVVTAMGFKKLPSHMPTAGSCSLAMAAAAHRPECDINAPLLPVKWGVVAEPGSGEVGHISFTSQEVTEPQEGRTYAGWRIPFHGRLSNS